MTTEEYYEALNIEAATVGMEWRRVVLTYGEEAWEDTTDKGLFSEWDPTHNDEHLGMLLAKVMDSGKAYSLTMENRHSIADPAWLATIYGKGNRVAREPGDNSWRVALVKACVVICGGELPEDVMAA